MLTTTLFALTAVVAAPTPVLEVAAPAIDPGTVQSVSAAEVVPTADCPTLQGKDGRPCGVVRQVELRRIDRDRALALLNAAQPLPPKSKPCKEAPTHALIVHTTKGTKVVAISLKCGTIGTASAQVNETRDFLRAQGLHTGL